MLYFARCARKNVQSLRTQGIWGFTMRTNTKNILYLTRSSLENFAILWCLSICVAIAPTTKQMRLRSGQTKAPQQHMRLRSGRAFDATRQPTDDDHDDDGASSADESSVMTYASEDTRNPSSDTYRCIAYRFGWHAFVPIQKADGQWIKASLGSYVYAEEAAQAYDAMASQLYVNAPLNFLPDGGLDPRRKRRVAWAKLRIRSMPLYNQVATYEALPRKQRP